MVGLTHHSFSVKSFSTAIEVVSIFFLKKNRGQNASRTHWLVTSFLHDDSAFMPESIFWLYRKKQRHWYFFVVLQGCKLLASRWWGQLYFLCCITRSNNKECILHVVSQKARRWVYFCHIAKSNDGNCMREHVFIARTQATSRHCNIWLLIARRTTMIVFLTSYCGKGATTTTLLHRSWGSKWRQVVLNFMELIKGW